MKTHTRITFLVCKLLLGMVASNPMKAQTTGASSSMASLSEWKTSDEITITGTILEVASKPIDGAPAGVNLRMDGAPGVAYANLGPRLIDSAKQGLLAGHTVQATGAVRQIGGQSYLLVRELVLDPQSATGQKLTVRNAQGFPAHTVTVSGNRPRRISANIGGAQ